MPDINTLPPSGLNRSDLSTINAASNIRGSNNHPTSQGSVTTAGVTYHLVKDEELTLHDRFGLDELRKQYIQEMEIEEQGAIKVFSSTNPTQEPSSSPLTESLYIRYTDGTTDIAMPYTIRGCDDQLHRHGNLFARSYQWTENRPKRDWVRETRQNGPPRTALPASSEGWRTLEPAFADIQLKSKHLDPMNTDINLLIDEDIGALIEQERVSVNERLHRVHELVVTPHLPQSRDSRDGPATIEGA